MEKLQNLISYSINQSINRWRDSRHKPPSFVLVFPSRFLARLLGFVPFFRCTVLRTWYAHDTYGEWYRSSSKHGSQQSAQKENNKIWMLINKIKNCEGQNLANQAINRSSCSHPKLGTSHIRPGSVQVTTESDVYTYVRTYHLIMSSSLY